jgi:hypothetical protein
MKAEELSVFLSRIHSRRARFNVVPSGTLERAANALERRPRK